ncbi:chromatin modification-related protein eaf-1-like isoform X2 [Patiria miniata]|uniref:Uncharacterized protein n=1 Tax=Patiria miniata TaxID=46514 RepID=A0A914BE72_PATMI|nr:chromatin modification-related protein eaf-1-like isoform X2 [Patiria miniata]
MTEKGKRGGAPFGFAGGSGSEESIYRIPPYYYIHVLNHNTNVTTVETGPRTFIRQDHERVIFGPEKMAMVPPRHYCIIENPVQRNEDGSVIEDQSGQIKLNHADQEIRLTQEPFPLYPGEILKLPVTALKVVPANSALRLRAILDFDDAVAKTKRVAGDEWLFEGPGTYIPRKEVVVDETVQATIIKANQAIKLRARKETLDRQGDARVTGEEWLVKKVGAYLPGAYEEVVGVVDAYVLTDKVASPPGQVVRAQAVRTTIAHVSLPSSGGIITSQVRAPVTSGTQVVITSAGSVSQARSTPTATATMTAKVAQYSLIKQQAIKQQLMQQAQAQQQAQIKRLQQAQAQAKVAQAQAEAQAQAVQKQLQSGQKPPTSNVTVSQVAATTSSLAQPQLTQAGQARAQLGGKTITRTIKNEELTAILKRQSQLLASQGQKSQKTTTTAITTLPLTTVAGLKGITLSGLTVSNAAATAGAPKGLTQAQAQAQGAGGAQQQQQQQQAQQQQGNIPMKPLTLPSMVARPKINFTQIQQMQKGQHQTKQQQLLTVKAQQLLAQQQKMQTGNTAVSQTQLQGASETISQAQIRISSPSVSVAVTGSLASQVVQTTSSQRQRLSQQVSTLTPQQIQQVRVQRVTTSQAQGSPAVVQRVGQVQQLATVRQQLQQQVKQSGTGAGATLSIQQAGKPVTIIPTVSGNSLLTVAKTVGGLSQTLPMTKGSQGSGLQPQQTVTVQSVPATQPSRGQGQASTSGAASVQVASSSQVTASIQPQGTIQSGSPVQVTLSAQTTKALSLSPAERQAALKSAAHCQVQQAQTQQAQIKQTGTVRRGCKRQLPRSSNCSNFKKRRGPTTAAATATTTTTAPSTSEPDVSVPDPNPGQT